MGLLEPKDEAGVAVGTPAIPGQVKPGDDVVFIGCGHEELCPELARPCSVELYGTMEYRRVVRGHLMCRMDGDRPQDAAFELFGSYEISTVEAVAAYAARAMV